MGNKPLLSILFGLFLLTFAAENSSADITVVRELVVAPKRVNVAANIGAVNITPNVRLDKASIDITVAEPYVDSPGQLLSIIVRGIFHLVNQSDHELKMTVGFPVSNSEYSSYDLETFTVVTDGKPREVFRRTGGYPRRLVHEYISGKLGPKNAQPPADVDRQSLHLFGIQHMGAEMFQNLMVWEETFSPGQERKVQVEYEVTIPLQETMLVRKRVKGSQKGIWPDEANNVPLDFIEKLPSGSYYFFDYYLTSGASWAGPIGFEDIVISFDQWWYDVEFYSSAAPDEFGWSERKYKPSDPPWMYYTLKNKEPTENIYFAIRPYGINDELAGKQRGHRKNILREPDFKNAALDVQNVQAGELYQFILHETINMSEQDCMLIERYYDKRSKRLSFPGTLDNKGCWVAMSFAEYENLFAFCYLAGTGRHYMDTGQSAECFIQKTAEEYLFLAHVSQDTLQKNSQMACYFTCVAKQPENRQILSGDK